MAELLVENVRKDRKVWLIDGRTLTGTVLVGHVFEAVYEVEMPLGADWGPIRGEPRDVEITVKEIVHEGRELARARPNLTCAFRLAGKGLRHVRGQSMLGRPEDARIRAATAFDLNRTLTKLERDDWGEPTFSSHLVTECFRARNVAVGALTAEQLRLLLGQRFSLAYVVPLAVRALEADPLAEADFDYGTLLRYAVSCGAPVYRFDVEIRDKLATVIERAAAQVDTLDESDRESVRRLLSDVETYFSAATSI